MTVRKATQRLSRALANADGRETRGVRRARWAAQGHHRAQWQGRPTAIVSRQQWEEQERERKRIEREMRREAVLSMAHNIALRIASFIARKRQTPSIIRRHQDR